MKTFWEKFEHCVGEKTFRCLQSKQQLQAEGRLQMLLLRFKKTITEIISVTVGGHFAYTATEVYKKFIILHNPGIIFKVC
jgi:hypothetical protein